MGRKETRYLIYINIETDKSKYPELRKLYNRYGSQGRSFWFDLQVTLAASNECFLDLSDEYDAEDVCLNDLFIKPSLAFEMLDLLAQWEAIDKELWLNHKIVWRDTYKDDYQDVWQKRKKDLQKPNPSGHFDGKQDFGGGSDAETTFSDAEIVISSSESAQKRIKENKRKENRIKEKKIKENEEFSPLKNDVKIIPLNPDNNELYLELKSLFVYWYEQNKSADYGFPDQQQEKSLRDRKITENDENAIIEIAAKLKIHLNKYLGLDQPAQEDYKQLFEIMLLNLPEWVSNGIRLTNLNTNFDTVFSSAKDKINQEQKQTEYEALFKSMVGN